MTWVVPEVAGEAAIRLFPVLVIAAAFADVMTRRIPNPLIGLAAALFPVFAIATAMPLWLFAMNVATGTVLLAIGYIVFRLGLFGGGDAKLIAVAGLWLGFPCVVPFILLTAAAGGVLAAAVGVLFMLRVETGVRSERLDRALARLSPDVPYGFAIAAGAILTTPLSWWMVTAGERTWLTQI